MALPESNQWELDSAWHGFQLQHTERLVAGGAPMLHPAAAGPAPVNVNVNVNDLAERVYRLMLNDLALRRERA